MPLRSAPPSFATLGAERFFFPEDPETVALFLVINQIPSLPHRQGPALLEH